MNDILNRVKQLKKDHEENQKKNFEDIFNYIKNKNYEIKIINSYLNMMDNMFEIILSVDRVYKFIDDNKDEIFIYNDEDLFNLYVINKNYYISYYIDNENCNNDIIPHIDNKYILNENDLLIQKDIIKNIFEDADNLHEFLKINNTYYTGHAYGTNSIRAFMYNVNKYEEDRCKIANINKYLLDKYNIDFEKYNDELKEHLVDIIKIEIENLKNNLFDIIPVEDKKTITGCKHFINNSVHKCLFLSHDDLTNTCRTIVNKTKTKG